MQWSYSIKEADGTPFLSSSLISDESGKYCSGCIKGCGNTTGKYCIELVGM
jgi:hypothetical protein